uniref:Uncharacterized protein n=1 Tax=Anguilla anguilla TaxID=7936 RepID=A0A0E9UGR2_ANGAN
MVVNTSRSLLCTLYREAVSFTSDSRLYKNAFLSRQVFHWQSEVILTAERKPA